MDIFAGYEKDFKFFVSILADVKLYAFSSSLILEVFFLYIGCIFKYPSSIKRFFVVLDSASFRDGFV